MSGATLGVKIAEGMIDIGNYELDRDGLVSALHNGDLLRVGKVSFCNEFLNTFVDVIFAVTLPFAYDPKGERSRFTRERVIASCLVPFFVFLSICCGRFYWEEARVLAAHTLSLE